MSLPPPPSTSGAVDDPRRVAAVERLALPGHAGDPLLDGLVQTLATACDVPIAIVNLVRPGMQTYPAEVGVGAGCTQVPDALSFCAEVVSTGEPLQVPDAAAHPVYGDNPLVRAGAIRAYAGEPLVHDGQVVGAVSVLDGRARTFTPDQLAVLRSQALLAGAVLSLRAASAWDPLTSLATRPVLLDRIDRALSRAERTGTLVAVLVVDVAGMAAINAGHGSATGDALLRRLAERLADACGPADSAARTSGDEFSVLLEDLASREEARARAAALLSAVRAPVALGGTTLEVSLRSGLATGPADTADILLAAAERSLTALGGVVTAEPVALDAPRLRRAVVQDELVLHYQPIVPLAGRRVEAVEALVRWQHPDHGLLPPAAFIPLAESSGLVVELGAWVLRTGAAQAAAWERAGRDLTVSLNLSPLQLADPTLVDTVRRVLLETGARPDRLRLELTESALMDQPGAEEALIQLQGAGIGLALDDFGTGYSSLSYLRRFPVDTMKIDRSFVAGLGRHPDDDAIVASIVGLARHTGKAVIAEGVETPPQAEALRALGVHVAQGFLWSPALPADELELWLDRWSPAEPARTAVAATPSRPRPRSGSPEERIVRMHAQGASLHTIAAAVNAAGYRTETGARWHVRSVARAVASYASAEPVSA